MSSAIRKSNEIRDNANRVAEENNEEVTFMNLPSVPVDSGWTRNVRGGNGANGGRASFPPPTPWDLPPASRCKLPAFIILLV